MTEEIFQELFTGIFDPSVVYFQDENGVEYMTYSQSVPITAT